MDKSDLYVLTLRHSYDVLAEWEMSAVDDQVMHVHAMKHDGVQDEQLAALLCAIAANYSPPWVRVKLMVCVKLLQQPPELNDLSGPPF